MQILRTTDNKILRNAAGQVLRADKYRGAFIFTVTATSGLVFILPLVSGAYSYDCWCDWGDGSESYINAYNSPYASHTYANAGIYTVRIAGKCQGFSVNNGTMGQYITKITSWGYCDFRKFDLFGAHITEVPMTPITGMDNITSFASFMRNTPVYTGQLSDQWFLYTNKVVDFNHAFEGCKASGLIPDTMFYNCPLVTSFAWVFSLTNLTGGLTNNLFRYNTLVTDFGGAFNQSNINQTLPEDIFWNNPEVLSFSQTFQNCRSLHGSIPEKLFRYNTKVTNMSYTFSIGGSVGSNFSGTVPRDLFYYNTEITTFEWLFRWNWSSLDIPNGLFRNNLKATNFYNTFFRCAYMVTGQYPFSAIDPNIPGDTEAAAALRRFSGKSPNFTGCFYTDQYYRGANTRYAPELWDNAVYSMISNIHDVNTFKSPANVYSNQASIAAGWK